MNRKRHGRRAVIALGVLLAAPALVVAQNRNHSFDVLGATAVVCTDGARFDGTTTAASSLNLLMTGEIYDNVGPNLLHTGDTHTFTKVGETYTFTVLGALTAGNTVRLSVSDVPGMIFGTEGDDAAVTVATCSVLCGNGVLDPGETCDDGNTTSGDGCSATCAVEAPTLGQWGAIALALALLAAAWVSRAGERGRPRS